MHGSLLNYLAGDAGGAGSEDCLKVNVYAPAGSKRGDNCKFSIENYVYSHPT